MRCRSIRSTTSVRGSPNADVRVLVSQAGAGALNGTTFYSYDVAPDAVVKLALDSNPTTKVDSFEWF